MGGELAGRSVSGGADLYGGFRLLGAPDASLTALLVHVDFVVFLIGAFWLTHYRWTYQRPAVIEQDSLDWTTGHRLGLVGVLGLGAGLLLWNLGGPLLWQDEAQSALISRTVLQTGLPRGTDGLNYFSQEYGSEYAENHLWRWHTWLPFYIVAGSYELLGDNTFAARFPGALLGWISIWLTYRRVSSCGGTGGRPVRGGRADDLCGVSAAVTAMPVLQCVDLLHTDERDRVLAFDAVAARRLLAVDLRHDAALSDALRLHRNLRGGIRLALWMVPSRTRETAGHRGGLGGGSLAAVGDLVSTDEIRISVRRADV